MGWTFAEIARELGYANECGPQQAIFKLLQSLPLDGGADEYRRMEAERLTAAQQAIWPEVEEGNFKAVDTFLRLSERRCRLLGLDLPQKHQVEGGVQVVGSMSVGGEERQVKVYLPHNNREDRPVSRPPGPNEDPDERGLTSPRNGQDG